MLHLSDFQLSHRSCHAQRLLVGLTASEVSHITPTLAALSASSTLSITAGKARTERRPSAVISVDHSVPAEADVIGINTEHLQMDVIKNRG